jgi:hypothetical protein
MATKTSDDQVRPPHLPMVEAVRDAKLVILIGSTLPFSRAAEAQTAAEKGWHQEGLAVGLKFYCEQRPRRENRR